MINTGIARLKVNYDGETSTVVEQFSQTPLQLHPPLYLEESFHPTMYIKSPSSGLLGGDEHFVDVDLAERSELELRTQAATLVYPGASSLTVNIKVANHAKLIYLPHPVILGAESALKQQVRIDLAGDASLVYSDTWCAGRIAMREKWMFASFDYNLAIYRDKKLAYRERWRIVPSATSLEHPLLCGEYTHFASLYSFGPDAERLVQRHAIPTSSWEDDHSWTLIRDGGIISRRCSKVDYSKLDDMNVATQSSPIQTSHNR